MENPTNKPWEEICGLPRGWHTIPIWGRCSPLNPKLPVHGKAIYGVIQFFVGGDGVVTQRKVISFVKPFIRGDFPATVDMAEAEELKFCEELQKVLDDAKKI